MTRAFKRELRGAGARIKSPHKSSVAGGAAAVGGTLSDGLKWGNEKVKDGGGERRSAAARSVIPPFECKAVIDLIVGARLQRPGEIHCLLGSTRSREWNAGVVEVARRRTNTLTA